MASTKQPSLTRAELRFWDTAFLGAQVPTLLKGKGLRINPAGVAHLAAEYADAALVERRLRRHGGAR